MRLGVPVAALLVGLVAGVGAPAAEPVPANATGIWGSVDPDGACEADRPILLVNTSAVILFQRAGQQTTVVFGPAAWLDGTLLLAREASDVVLPPLEELSECRQLPAQLYLLFGEAIALFQEFDAIKGRCDTPDGTACVDAVFRSLDVSGDDKLSQAEIGRALRAAAFFIGYETFVAQQKEAGEFGLWQTYTVSLDKISGTASVASLLTPFFTDNLIASYDFDADGLLSLKEILQDRGTQGDG